MNEIIKSVNELAKHLGLHRKTVSLQIKDGLLPNVITTLTGKKVGWTRNYLAESQKNRETSNKKTFKLTIKYD